VIATGATVPVVPVNDEVGDHRPLTAYLDRPTVVVFFKRSCETSRLALPVFAQWSALVPEVGLLGISQDTSSENAEFFEEMGIEMPIAFDREPYPASAAFDIDAVPAWFLLQDGEISWSWAGWNAEKAAELTAILGETAGTDIALDDLDALPAFRPG